MYVHLNIFLLVVLENFHQVWCPKISDKFYDEGHCRRSILKNANPGIGISGAHSIRLYKKEQDGFKWLSLGVHFDVDPRVSVFFQGHHFGTGYVVIGELFAAGVNAVCLVCQSLAADHFVLELHVGQLAFQLWGRCKGYFEDEVVVKGLGVENAVLRQDLMVETGAILGPVILVQFVLRGYAPGFLVSRAWAGNPRSGSLRESCLLVFPVKGKGLQRFCRCHAQPVSWRTAPASFRRNLSTSARVTLWTRKLLAFPLEKSMSKRSASEPGTRTSFSLSLGTETYGVARGLASVRSKVIRLIARSAFMAPNVFSVNDGLRFSGTDILYNWIFSLI